MNVSVRPVVEARFAANEQRVAGVRRLLREQLNEWKQPTIIDDAMLATTEVFTNAVRHGSKGPKDIVTVAFELSGGDLRVRVTDSSAALPTLRDVSLLEVGGRGLHLLDALTKSWGADLEQDGVGKTVWFTIALACQHEASCPSARSSHRDAASSSHMVAALAGRAA
ncbi:ATP-binding protein [Streptomyces scabiei]|uniref:ATP-binding protein n=1 Tax=Streptomyces scabiei TaxID=1930 RepID=UPI0038F69870